jgi:hypothetical protein
MSVEALRSFLASQAPARAADAMAHLGISQSAFSRLIEAAGADVLAVGRARGTRYLGSRQVPDVGRSTPIFEILPHGTSRRLGLLHAVLPASSFYFESESDDADSALFDDLPYFVDDLRPAGFLGRLVPRQHPELQLPPDIQLWTATQALQYLTRFGWNLPGSLLVGDASFRLHLEHASAPPEPIAAESRPALYPQLANDVLSQGTPGSSAAGEQPKFLATRTPGPTAVLVKFSPPAGDASSRRIADLLIAEHHALETMRAHGHEAAQTELIEAGDRTFLEVQRFDRFPGGGRQGLLSLRVLDLQFVGGSGSWVEAASRLAEKRIIDPTLTSEIRRRHLFGRLIGNTDMHGGNLSFVTHGMRIVALAPAYDMAPALYAPAYGQLRTSSFDPGLPEASDAPYWSDACSAALQLWTRVAADSRVSESFRAVASANADVVARARDLQRLLPAIGKPPAPR